MFEKQQLFPRSQISRIITKLITAITRHHQQLSYARAHQTEVIRQQRLIIKLMRSYTYSKNKDRVGAKKKKISQKCQAEMKDTDHEACEEPGRVIRKKVADMVKIWTE